MRSNCPINCLFCDKYEYFLVKLVGGAAPPNKLQTWVLIHLSSSFLRVFLRVGELAESFCLLVRPRRRRNIPSAPRAQHSFRAESAISLARRRRNIPFAPRAEYPLRAEGQVGSVVLECFLRKVLPRCSPSVDKGPRFLVEPPLRLSGFSFVFGFHFGFFFFVIIGFAFARNETFLSV